VKIYRVTKKEFVKDLSGEGARLYGGRWNKKGRSMLYFSEHLSLCVLEMLTRIDFEFLTDDYAFIEVEIADKLIVPSVKATSISKNWRADPPTFDTQDFGSKWVASEANFALSVPSAVLPNERNILVNPNHKLISKLKITNIGKLDLGPRLIP
jgi:RES domain-containing protein